MKKSVALLIVISLIINLFILAGCGENSEQEDIGKIEFKEFTNEDVTFENDQSFVKNQLLITADEKLSYSDVEKAVGEYDGKIVGCIEFTNDYQVEFENTDYNKLSEIMADLSDDLPDSDITLHNTYTFDSASTNYKECYTQDYSKKDGNWWRQSIQLTDLESKNYDYQNVKVGVIDTLFDTHNPDLSEYFAAGGVFDNDESKLEEEATKSYGNHGTNVTGFIAAKKGNGIGIDGVANNISLYGAAQRGDESKVFSSDKYKNNSSSMKFKWSIAQLLSKDVKIINISFGDDEILVGSAMGIHEAQKDLSTFYESMETFLKKYIDNGKEFVIVKSAGNENDSEKGPYIYCKEGATKEHPYGIKAYNEDADGDINNNKKCSFTATADFDYLGAIEDTDVQKRIIIVGSSTKENNRANHSVCGERVDIYAPGENLTTLTTGGNDGAGTSYATGIVSGVAALIWGINPDISADSIKFIIKSHAIKPIISEIDKTTSCKFLVNANYAVEYAKNFEKTITMKSGENNGKLLGYVRKLNENQEIEELKSSCDITIYKGNAKEAHAELTETVPQEAKAYTNLKTDNNGEFDIDLPEGDYYLSAKFNNSEYNSTIKTFTIVKGTVCYLDDIVLHKKQSNNTYHNTQYGWSVDLPDEWNQYGMIEDTGNSNEGYFLGNTFFYHKELHEKYTGGQIMHIFAVKKHTKYNPNNMDKWINQGEYLGESNEYYYFCGFPTSVEYIAEGHYSYTDNTFDSEGQRIQDEYKTLEKAAEKIRNSFKVDNFITSETTTSETKWKDSYVAYINNLHYDSNSSKFNLFDLDKNGIPELFYDSGFGLSGASLSGYYSEKINTINYSHASVSYYGNHVCIDSGKQGTYNKKIIEVRDGQLQTVFDGQYAAKSSEFDMNNPDDFIYSYRLNEQNNYQNIGYNEFNEKVSALFDQNKASVLNFKYNGSEIINAIQEY